MQEFGPKGSRYLESISLGLEVLVEEPCLKA